MFFLSILSAKIDDDDYADKKKANTMGIWTPLRAVEAASYLFSIWAYFMFYYRDHWGFRFDTYAFTFFFANGWFVFVIYLLTKVVRAIKTSKGLKFKSFVLSQISRIGIQTILMACLTTYTLSAMLRVPITAPLLPVFEKLSLRGITCADPAAFLSAFEASAANASCPALPYCGYDTYEDLCQAV
eukprot:jgi/Chrpa1/25711/Chrysochromulina_OHIO_Genome00027899-RA